MIYYFFHKNIFVVDNITSSEQIGQVAYKFLILTLTFYMIYIFLHLVYVCKQRSHFLENSRIELH